LVCCFGCSGRGPASGSWALPWGFP